MKHRLQLAALALLPTASAAFAQSAGQPSIDQLQSVAPVMSTRDAPQWSPDGSKLVFIGTADGGLWTIDPKGGAPELIKDRNVGGPLGGGAAQLRWSPDGRLITYLRSVPGGNDIFGWDVAQRSERRITHLSGNVRSYTISPDSRSIALANDRQGSEDIWVVDVANGKATRITSTPLYEVFPSWTPDGSRVLFTRLDDRWVDHDVFTIAPTGGPERHVLADQDFFDYRQGASFGFTRVSPDGKTMLFRSQRSGWTSYWVAPLGGGPPREIAPEQADQSEARWSPDGSQILFLSISNGTQSLEVVAASGGKARALVTPQMGMVSHAEWSPDGSKISYLLGTPTAPADLYLVAASGGSPSRLTTWDQSQATTDLVAPEKISWVNDGLTINAYLYRPKNLRPGDRAPVIMYVHGGPTGQFSDNYQLQPQFFASRGYLVIAPNVRGSSGYGKRFEDANNRDWGHGDLRDVLAGVAWAKRQSYVDPEKIGITGISYGGMLTMYAISFAPGVFQAAISGSGYGDVKDFHTVVPVLQHSKLLQYELGKWPSTPEVEAIYRRSSAILKAKDATTPAMIIHGYGLDVLDTEYAAWKYARELAKNSKIVEYKAYPGETYYVYGRENTKQMLQDMLGFFDRYLKDPSSDAGEPEVVRTSSRR